MLGRLIRLVVVGGIAGMVAASVAAVSMKRRLVPTTDESADEITAVGIFGPLAFHSTSSAFRGGVVECWYGGGVLDLRDATLAPEGATLKVRAIFGGGQIIVPPSWKVVSRIQGMGGIQDIRTPQGHSAIDPELVIEGVLVAGGFAVSSELQESEEDWLATMKEQQGSATEAKDAIAEKAEDAVSKAESKAESVSDAVEDKADSVTDAAEDAAESTTDELESAVDAAGDASEEMAPTS
jgi:hypothetical protein